MLEVQLLGKFAAKLDDQHLDIPSRPAQALLAYLILNTHKSFRREKLAGLLWPESDETNARNNLRQALWRLRKLLGDGFFLADKVSVGFNHQADYRLDAKQLQADIDDNTSIETLIQMVAVYEDKLLPGFYDSWVTLEQERLQAVYEDRMQLLLTRLVETVRWRETREWAEQWIAQGLTPEPAYRALMTAQAALGDLTGVATVYQRCRDALDEELGVEPSAETQVLFQKLTSGELQLQPQKQLAKPAIPVKLPVQTTPFVGREDELSRLATLLTDPTVKLITVLGPGGMGKTRLAIEAARAQAEAFTDGVYFVPLAPLDDPGFISSEIAEEIGLILHFKDHQEHWKNDTQVEQILAYLRDKHLLLILDNSEHLLTTAFPSLPEWDKSVDQLAAEILQVAPHVKILATSRERLNLHGETLVPLDGLTISAPVTQKTNGALASEDAPGFIASGAVELFRQGARRVRPNFELEPDNVGDVIDICRLVGGMPLGIELAAAWIELLSPAEIVAEIRQNLDFLETDLGNIPDRHRSVRLIFESTWQRLTAAERATFQQLSIFRGGFTRDAAQTITGASLRTLMVLVNKSLLRPNLQGRYHLHELLRQFAAEHLTQDPLAETAVKDRHCAYFATFLHQKEPDLRTRKQAQALNDIEVELDNVRTAWNWAVTHKNSAALQKAVESVCEFIRVRGRIDEGWRFFQPAARAFGWQGFWTAEDIPDSDTMFKHMLQMLDAPADKIENGDDRQIVLSKILARDNRLY
ncbi:MAG: hypothetical protein KDI79_15005 [Anaerolineae bacterium]|nr:hypothetical protein [Anaerolineae bacterium]